MASTTTAPPIQKTEQPDGTARGSLRIPLLTGLLHDVVTADSLLDGLPIGVALLDPQRRVIRLNSRGAALLGIGLDEAYGLPCHHVIRSARCFRECPISAEHIGNSVNPVNQTCGDQNGDGAGCPVTHETDIIDRQRRKVSVRACVVPLRDDQGNPVGFMEVLEEMHRCPPPAPTATEDSGLEGFISHSQSMQPLFAALRIIAETDSNVLITGETGTGKDLLAEALHKASQRSSGPFVKINCGALPEHLLESELFGHMRGAFTGAVSDKPGRFRLAAGGSLFLTEIGDLPMPLQVKLLTVLDDQCIHPLGATRPVSVDVRIIAATHRDLEQMVREGRFREDLMFRLNVVRLHVPPLREREGDIRLLLEHFLKRMATSLKRKIQRFTPEALKLLCEYPWPGNVRELRNVVEYAIHFSSSEEIGVASLPKSMLDRSSNAVCGARFHEATHTADKTYTANPSDEAATGGLPSPHALPFGQPKTSHTAAAHTGPSRGDTAHEKREEPVFHSWSEKERHMILDALEHTGGRRQQAADMLGWSRSTLWRKLITHGLV